MASSERKCDRRDDAAELALGLLTGTDRADALEHLETCASCRTEVEGLAEISDRLLLLAPPAEPPPGFESDVLAAMRTPHQPSVPVSRRWHRALITVGSVAAASIIALGVGWALGSASQDHELSRQAAMVTPSGRDVGSVRIQEGDPDWLLVSVPGWRHWDEQVGHALDYRVRVEMSAGASVVYDDVSLSPDGAWATPADFDPSAVNEVSIVDSSGRVWCTGRLSPPV